VGDSQRDLLEPVRLGCHEVPCSAPPCFVWLALDQDMSHGEDLEVNKLERKKPQRKGMKIHILRYVSKLFFFLLREDVC
jgi:hypothetical protein